MKTRGDSKELAPIRLPNSVGSVDLEKTLFNKFKPGKFLMTIQSPSVNKLKLERSRTTHNLKAKRHRLDKIGQGSQFAASATFWPKKTRVERENTTVNTISDMKATETTDIQQNNSLSPRIVEDIQDSKILHIQNMETGEGQSGQMTNTDSLRFVTQEAEIGRLQRKITDLQKEATNQNPMNRSFRNMDWESYSALNMSFVQKEDNEKLKNILGDLVMKTHELFKGLKQRGDKMSNLLDFMEGAEHGISEHDFRRMRVAMEDLKGSILHCAKTEIDLGSRSRELEKKNMEHVKLRSQYQKLAEKCEHTDRELHDLKRLKTEQDELVNSQKRQLELEKSKNKENEKKIEMLEKRIELILECDISMDKDNLRKALTELVKENEGLKRENFLKIKELRKNKDDLSKLNAKMNRQNKKIDAMTKSKKGLSAPEMHTEEQDKYNFEDMPSKDDPLNLLKAYQIPVSLDFRTNSLRLHFAELLNTIMEQGSHIFMSQLSSLESIRDKREAISFMTSQMISCKEFCDKLHFLLRESVDILRIRELRELMIFLNRYMKHIFSSEHLYLWVADGTTGIYSTYNSQRQELRCLPTGGIFRDCVENAKPLNKRNMKNTFICEMSTGNEKHSAESALLFPIKNTAGRVCAVLEISNITDGHYGFDEEYFGIVLSHLCSAMLLKLYEDESRLQEIKVKDLLFMAFLAFCKCNTRAELAIKIQEWTNRIFGISSSKFIFHENKQFEIYNDEHAQATLYPNTVGIAGEVVKFGKGQIISDMNNSKDHNVFVDLRSLLPAIATPVVSESSNEHEKKRIVGVLQLVLKQKKTGLKEERSLTSDHMMNVVGVDEPTENMINKHTQFIAASIEIFESKQQHKSIPLQTTV